tara:strand:- start:469 stop:720 length:252 start_codon:yes stop_codon:yes gene_type:complete
MNIELSELKKIIREEIENRFGGNGHSMLLESPRPKTQTYRGVNYEIPVTDSVGNVLSEDVKLVYITEMQNFLDAFLGFPEDKQ